MSTPSYDGASQAMVSPYYTGKRRRVTQATPASQVTGPSGSTDEAVATFDGTTGLVVKETPVTINRSGDITKTGNIQPSIDNSKDLGSQSLAYKDYYAKGDYLTDGGDFVTSSGNFIQGGVARGDVFGPASTISTPLSRTIPLFDDTTGKNLSESIVTVTPQGDVATSGNFFSLGVPRGDLSGPSSATSGGIPRFNGSSGKVLQNTNVLIDSNDNIAANNINAGLTNLDQRVCTQNSSWEFKFKNKAYTDPNNALQIYGADTNSISSTLIVAASGINGNESCGFAATSSTDQFTIFTAGDNGVYTNWQDEDSSNSRVAYVGSNGAFVNVSSKLNKNRIKDKKNNDVLERFKNLKVRSYGYNYPEEEEDWTDKKKKRVQKKREKMAMGLVLEELFEVFPNCCADYYNKLDRKARKTNLKVEEEIPERKNSGVSYTHVQLYHIMAFKEYMEKTDARIKNLEEKLIALQT
jgi:hypothetical protein